MYENKIDLSSGLVKDPGRKGAGQAAPSVKQNNGLAFYMRITTMLQGLRAAKAWQPVFGADHFLIQTKSGTTKRFYIVKLTTMKDRPIALMVARLWVRKSPECDGWTIAESAAQRGYGPAIYDATMELLYPEGLMADLHSVSPAARKVWDYYYTNRHDVAQQPKPSSCKLWEKPSLDQIYLKKPGPYKKSVMSPDQFNNHPSVVKYFGAPQSFGDPAADMWDGTPDVPGGFE